MKMLMKINEDVARRAFAIAATYLVSQFASGCSSHVRESTSSLGVQRLKLFDIDLKINHQTATTWSLSSSDPKTEFSATVEIASERVPTEPNFSFGSRYGYGSDTEPNQNYLSRLEVRFANGKRSEVPKDVLKLCKEPMISVIRAYRMEAGTIIISIGGGDGERGYEVAFLFDDHHYVLFVPPKRTFDAFGSMRQTGPAP